MSDWGIQAEGVVKRQVTVFSSEVAVDLGFLKVTKTTLSYTLPHGLRLPDGGNPQQTRFTIDRRNSAAALVFQPATGLLHFVRQFRYATYNPADEPTPENGWLIELAAGVIERNESSKESIAREISEELGFNEIKSLELIGSFYLSPGAASERLFLYCACVGGSDMPMIDHSLGDADEWIEAVSMTVPDFLGRVEAIEVFDAKMVAAAEYIRRRPDLFGVG